MTSQLDLAMLRTGQTHFEPPSCSLGNPPARVITVEVRLIIWTGDRDTHAQDGANLPGDGR